MNINITSRSFRDGDLIPVKHTCDGEDLSPALAWTQVPQEAKSLALICDDPDAPGKTWVHWVLYNIIPGEKGLPEGVPPVEQWEGKLMQGVNDFGQVGYGGPCPPGGTHRYYFKIYGLDKTFAFKGRVTKAVLEKEMKGHILAEGVLLGRYKR